MAIEPEMSSSDLIELLRLLDEASIEVWLDGGWGVDALLGRQTRRHRDVDLIVPVSHVPRLRDILGRRGFAVKDGTPPTSFVLSNEQGLEVDVHAVVFDDEGNGVYTMQNGEVWIYPAEGFSAHRTSANLRLLYNRYGHNTIDGSRPPLAFSFLEKELGEWVIGGSQACGLFTPLH